MSATISINRELKERAETFFGNYGISLTDAIANFINSVIDNDNKYVKTASKGKNKDTAFGSLSRYANAELREREKDAYEIYVREKYGSC
jgi:antitoxin component of RelBE/YafQ-DinJ toxin-antitoxin module